MYQRKKAIELQQNEYQQKEKIFKLESVLTELFEKNLIEQEVNDLLADLSGPSEKLLETQQRKRKRQPDERCYSQELKIFALNLNFFAPKAYKYVRETFHTCLPHPVTISSWYQNSNCNPGFTSEAFITIKRAAKKAARSGQKFVCNVVFDEIQVKNHIEWDDRNSKSIGYVEFGENDFKNNVEATQILVFMVVCLNRSWKMPVGFFPIASVDAEQRKNLLLHCIENLLLTGVIIVGVTFDGSATNFSMSNLLGCDLSSIQNEYSFKVENYDGKFMVFPDPMNMLKLIRNCLEEHSVLVIRSEKIEWKYLVYLQFLQDKLYPKNKLREAHTYFKKHNMKVKLTVQAFCRSLADTIDYCRDVLKIKEFENSRATSEFIRNINDIIDMLNSKNTKGVRFDKAMNKANYNEIKQICSKKIDYLQSLQLQNGCFLIDSHRKMGFVGLIVCLQNLKTIYKNFIATNIVSVVPTYKLHQNHLKVFFSSINTRLGHKDRPTVLQFIAAYKQLIARCQIRKENKIISSIPLEEISILKTDLKTAKEIKDEINITTDRSELFEVAPCQVEFTNLNEHNYMFNPNNLSEYTKHIIEYIGGHLVYKLHSQLNCQDCLSLLGGDVFLYPITNDKSTGYFKYVSSSVTKICEIAEKEIGVKNLEHAGLISKNLRSEIYLSCLNKTSDNRNIFTEKIGHPIDHYNLLIRLTIKMYLDLRYFYINERNLFTKVCNKFKDMQ